MASPRIESSHPGLRYILSDSFDYANYLLDDAGPRFAEMYGWPTCGVQATSFTAGDVFIIDWYLNVTEFESIGKAIVSCPDSLFVFHLVDPWPFIAGTPAYSFLLGLSASPNVVFSGPYFPTMHTAALVANGPHAFVLTPYLYEPERELPIAHKGKDRTILVSGNIGLPDYPVRHAIHRSGKINPLFWGRTRRLAHSGYNLANAKHDMVRDKYVKALGLHVFSAVCSSRLRLEFLKYREIAYAGCVPVGDLPGTLINCPSDGIVVWRRDILKLHKDFSRRDTEARALVFRQFMRQARERESWRAMVTTQFLNALRSGSRSGSPKASRTCG